VLISEARRGNSIARCAVYARLLTRENSPPLVTDARETMGCSFQTKNLLVDLRFCSLLLGSPNCLRLFHRGSLQWRQGFESKFAIDNFLFNFIRPMHKSSESANSSGQQQSVFALSHARMPRNFEAAISTKLIFCRLHAIFLLK
jgi:hypothetical protein